MVATVSNLKSAAQAGYYYAEIDDYYRAGDKAPSRWHGRLAAELGLTGQVSGEDFTRVLEGKMPTGEVIAEANGQHRPGTDITLSPDKSVSELALRAGDERVITALWESAEEAIAELEESVGARVKAGGEIEVEQTGSLVAAMFLHTSSRNLDPQAHVHAVIANATRRSDGKLVALSNEIIYQRARDTAQSFHTRLSHKLQALGYSIDRQVLRSGLVTAQVRGVPESVLEQDSSRSAQVEENLAKMGLSRKDCTREQAQEAALKGRKSKKVVDHDVLHQRWREEGRQLAGGELMHLRTQAELRSRDGLAAEAKAEAADLAVAAAAEHLVERDARFTARDLEREARGFAVGSTAGVAEIRDAIKRAERDGHLIGRTVERYDRVTRRREKIAAWTTPEAVRDEERMLAAVEAGKGQAEALVRDPDQAERIIEAASQASEFGFNSAQKSASLGLLTSDNLIELLHGVAGSAKTTSVLKLEAAVASQLGYEAIGLAATGDAADQLREGAQIERTDTVAGYLAKLEHQGSAKPERKRVILVDEAGMLASPTMGKLLHHAREAGHRVVLAGDVKQRGSIERGEAITQLMDAGIPTYQLEVAVRQRTEHARDAVTAVRGRDADRALEALRRQPGGGLVEVAEERRGARPGNR